MEAAPNIFRTDNEPYFATMLLGEKFAAIKALAGAKNSLLPLPARIPFVTIVGVYFCHLVDDGIAMYETTTTKCYRELLSTARDAACATIDENLVILPRLIADESLSHEEADNFRRLMVEMRAWAHVCAEPVSLGQISLAAQMNWVQTHTFLTASNSTLLQAFLYLCEKRRLEALETKGAAATTTTDNAYEYERLLGALLEDPRVAPVLLQNGRPTTVPQCIRALHQWCGLPSPDAKTLGNPDIMAKTTERMKIVQRSNAVRQEVLLGVQIVTNRYGVTKDMRDRLSAREGEDDDALRRYLIWEATTPNCLKLEAALFRALRKVPQWQELRLSISSRRLPRSEWAQAIINVIDAGLHVLFTKTNRECAVEYWEISCSLENAILKLALKLPGHEESLRAAYAETFPTLAAQWKDSLAQSFADELLQATMPRWQTTFNKFDIESVYKNPHVEMLAHILCMLPSNVDGLEENSKGQDKGKNKRRAKKPAPQKKKQEEKPQGDIIGDILKNFMEAARPVLEEMYGKGQDPGRSIDNIEVMMGQTTI